MGEKAFPVALVIFLIILITPEYSSVLWLILRWMLPFSLVFSMFLPVSFLSVLETVFCVQVLTSWTMVNIFWPPYLGCHTDSMSIGPLNKDCWDPREFYI